MSQVSSKLKTFLMLSISIFLFLLLIHLALPAVFLLLQIPSFAIGDSNAWILRWQNDATGFGIQFNLLFLAGMALVASLIVLLFRSRKNT